jgi:hypothetical protein
MKLKKIRINFSFHTFVLFSHVSSSKEKLIEITQLFECLEVFGF